MLRLVGAVMCDQAEAWSGSRYFSERRMVEMHEAPLRAEASSLRTGSRRHRISTAFRIAGRRADSLRIGRYTNFLDTTSPSLFKIPAQGRQGVIPLRDFAGGKNPYRSISA